MVHRWSFWTLPLALVSLTLLLPGCAERIVYCPTAPGVPADGTGGATRPTATPGLLTVRRIHIIETAMYPPKVAARIVGELPDTCTEVGAVSQSRSGNVITVTVATVRKGQSCAEVLRPADVQVWLESITEPGEYVVRINGVEYAFKV